jgi:hypothetical protein
MVKRGGVIDAYEEVGMTISPLNKDEQKKQLKKDEKAHKAQAKADKLQRKSLDNGKIKKAEKAQDKADEKTREAAPAVDDLE